MIEARQNSYYKWGILAILGWAFFMYLQAWMTPLHIDETYYWMYSRNMSWGYFDHPPAVAVLIWLSDHIFNGTIGVRFFSVFSQVLTFLLIYKTIVKGKNYADDFLLKLFLVFVLLPLNHIFGFITTPDVPLLLSAALFFFALRGVVEERNSLSYVLWTFSMAMMLYSKYHSGLVILLTLIALPSLFKNWKTYASGAIALLMFVPHVLWQYENDWVSFTYHLSERAVVYSWTYPLEYVGNVLVVCNPILIFFLVKLIRKRWSGEYERACYFVVLGFLAFFMWQSFRVRVQPQWLIVIYIPSLILMRDRIASYKVSQIGRVVLWMLPLFIAMRVFMIWDVLPQKFNVHGMKEYCEMIDEHAGERDVMFFGSYKRASAFTWYTDQEYTHSFNGAPSRKNQYSIWQQDSIYHGKEVYFVGDYWAGKESRFYEDGQYYGRVTTYEPVDKMKAIVKFSEIQGDSLYSEVMIENPYGDAVNYDDEYFLIIRYLKNGKRTVESHRTAALGLSKDQNRIYHVKIPIPTQSNVDAFGFSIRHSNLPGGAIYEKHDYPPTQF